MKYLLNWLLELVNFKKIKIYFLGVLWNTNNSNNVIIQEGKYC